MQHFTTSVSVWIADPANLVTLNPDMPGDFRCRTSLMEPDFNGDWGDWLKLGTATITYSVDLESEEARAKALEQVNKKIEEVTADTQKKLEALRAARQNLLAITYNATDV